MKWIKNNAAWFTSMLAALVILIGWLSGAFGYVVATEAKPVIKEEIRIHELEFEPRMQSVETLASGNSQKLVDIEQKMDDSLEIQKKILEEVSK